MVAGWSSGSGSCWYWGRALAALVACCLLSLGCSPRNTAADAAGVADAAVDGGFDVVGDLADSEVDSATEVQDGQGAEAGDLLDTGGDDGAEVVDAITDTIVPDAGPDIDVVKVDVPIVDATPAVDAAVPCSATEIPVALTGTVEFEAAAYIYNPVVMGCGKGAPKSVKEGTPGCCNCAPPYSCYCNGECGWLRAPDLVKPQHDGQAVWTGKWVVSLGESYDFNGGPSTLHVQKWQPESGKGFEMVALPSPWLFAGYPKAFMWGKQVVLAAELANNAKWTPGGYAPAQPVYLYEPDTNVFTKITMPYCGKLLLAGGTLVCVAAGKSWDAANTAGLYVYDKTLGTWALVKPPATLVPKDWWIAAPENTAANALSVYLVGAILSSDPWPDGTKDFPGPGGHILKYEVNNQKWSDIGFVPVEWHAGPLMMDHIGIVRTKGAIQAARFRLDTFTWEVGPKMTYDEGGMQPVLSPCGLVFGDGTLWGGNETGGMQYRPILLANDLSWKLLSPWGYPNDAVTSRKGPNTVMTDQEIFALGGFDGPPEGNFVYHKDSYRYPLAALCNNGASK